MKTPAATNHVSSAGAFSIANPLVERRASDAQVAHLALDAHVDLVQAPAPRVCWRIIPTRLVRILAANIGPNRLTHFLTVSWQMSIPRSKARSSTVRSASG